MKKINVTKEEAEHKIAYGILGVFAMILSVGTALMVWDEIFFRRHEWTTRKNLLKHLLSEPKIRWYKHKYVDDFRFEFEDGSHIATWWKDGVMRDWSFHHKNEGQCLTSWSMDISTKVLDRQIADEVKKLVELTTKQESEKA